MKKFALIIVALACSTLLVSASDNNRFLNIGGRLGIISSSEQIPMSGDQLKESITAAGTGWTGNVFARLYIPKLPVFIQPELQYTNTTIKIPTVGELVGIEEEQQTETHRYIDLPVLLGAEISLPLVRIWLNAGPVFAITSEKGFGDLTEDDFVAAYNEPKMSWTAGLGVKVLSLVGEIRYNGNFKNQELNTENLAGNIDTNRTSWNLSIGVMF